jgi:hypothetical protein
LGNCVRCYAPAGGLYLCTNCVIALRIELADVAGIVPDNHGKGHVLPSLPEDLTITLTSQDQLGEQGDPITGSGEIPLIFKQHAGEAVWILDQVLQQWATTLDHYVPGVGPRGLALWMFNHLELVQKHPDAAQLVDEVTDAIHQARRAIDRPADERIYLGRCGAQIHERTGWIHECREELYGYPWLDRALCPVCGTEYDIAERQSWLRERKDKYQGTVAQVAGFLRATGVQCTTEQVRGYARSRNGHPPRLEHAGVNDQGHRTYLISDALAAIKERYVRKGSRNVSEAVNTPGK